MPHHFATWDIGSGKSVYREDPEPIAGSWQMKNLWGVTTNTFTFLNCSTQGRSSVRHLNCRIVPKSSAATHHLYTDNLELESEDSYVSAAQLGSKLDTIVIVLSLFSSFRWLRGPGVDKSFKLGLLNISCNANLILTLFWNHTCHSYSDILS